MTAEGVAILVALITLAGVVIAGLAGLGGAVLGARISANATQKAAEMAHEEADAARREARRARFTERVTDLAVELVEAADQDHDKLLERLEIRETAGGASLPAFPGATRHRVDMRLRMLLLEDGSRRALDRIADLYRSMVAVLFDGKTERTAKPTEREWEAWEEVSQEYAAAIVAFEERVRVELMGR